jgi:MoxR-like ATPase
MMNDNSHEFIESLKTKVNDKDRVYRVPIAEIDFTNYKPVKWGVKYVQLTDEADELEQCMLTGMNYLIEGDKGLGKTQLVHNLCVKHDMAIVSLNCSDGTKIGDLIGRPQINEFGSYFQLGVLPTAIEVANHFGRATLYMDEFNALQHEIQKATNSVTDGRRSITANGKVFRLNEGVKLSVIATMNPSTYSGVNTLTEDSRSRFIGAIWDYPTNDSLKKIVDWSGIPVETVVDPMLQLVQNIHNLRTNADVDYSLSPRDIAQFTECYRMWTDSTLGKPLVRSLRNTVLSKFSDLAQRELVKKQIAEIFGVVA